MDGQHHMESHQRLERNIESLLAGQLQVMNRLAHLEGKASMSGAIWGTISGGLLGLFAALAPRLF